MKVLKHKFIRLPLLAASAALLIYASVTFYKDLIDQEDSAIIATKINSVKVNSGNYNKELVAKGMKTVEVDESKPEVFVINHAGPFDGMSMFNFLKKSEALAINAKDGDKLYLNIQSSGGSAIACKTMSGEVDVIKEELNLSVSAFVDIYAMSCGYMLAASADNIYMAKSAMIGNIGVLRTYFKKNGSVSSGVVGKLLTSSSVKKEVIGSTRIKELLGGQPSETEADVDFQKFMMARSAKEFFSYVSDSRGERLKNEKMAFNGLYYGYEDAKEIGLVDGHANFKAELRKLHRQGYKITIIN